MFIGDTASTLADLVMYYCDDAPGYNATMHKLLAARDSEPDYSKDDKLLILAAMNEYLNDTAERVTPSYDSPPFSSPAVADILSQRETIFFLRERLLQDLHQGQSES